MVGLISGDSQHTDISFREWDSQRDMHTSHRKIERAIDAQAFPAAFDLIALLRDVILAANDRQLIGCAGEGDKFIADQGPVRDWAIGIEAADSVLAGQD